MPPVVPFPLGALRYSLRRNDKDLDRTRDGVTGRYYGGRFRIGETNNWVAALCKTLGMLGFEFDAWSDLDVTKPDKRSFESVVEWAVREFQAAAKLPSAAQAGGSVALTATNGTLYTGPVSGVLTPATRDVMRAWYDAAPRLACPVVLSGFDPQVSKDELTSVTPGPTPSYPNLWLDDEANDACRVYARDVSGRYKPLALGVPPRDSNNFQIAGAVVRYQGRYRPVTDQRHAWKRAGERSEVLPDDLFVSASDTAAHALQLRTFRIIRAVTDAEACGFFEGSNAYDDQVVSVGLYNWTVNPSGSGELVTLLAYLRQLDPVAYRDLFGRYGLAGTRAWPRLAGAPDGLSLLDAKQRKFARDEAKVAYDTEEGTPAALGNNFNEQRYLRNWHSYYRLVMAARTCDRYRRVMWDVARLRLRMILDVAWPGGSTADPYPFVGTAATRATLVDTLRSERLLSMALRWHVKRPTHVTDDAGGYKARVVDWGNGAGVPASGNQVVIVGIDTGGLLRIRIFDPATKHTNGNRLTDTDETQLPASQAAAIGALKTLIPTLLPEHHLNDGQQADVVRKTMAILGLSHWPGHGIVRAWKSLSALPIFTGNLDVTAWGEAHEAAWAGAMISSFEDVVEDETMPKIDDWQDVATIAASGFGLPEVLFPSPLPPLVKFHIDSTGGDANPPAFNALTGAPGLAGDPPAPQWGELSIMNPLRTAFGTRIAATDRARLARVRPKSKFPNEWAIEVRNSADVLIRRFRATLNSSQATRIFVQETPILDRAMVAVGAAAMDVSGLPPYRVSDPGNVPLVTFQAETPTPGTQAAVVAAFTGGAATLSGAVRDTFVQAVTAALPLTEVGLGATPAIVRLESCMGGPVRWLVSGTNPNLEFYTVRLVAAGKVEVDRPGASRRYGGATLSMGNNSPAVAQLRKDLRTLGFLGVPELTGATASTFDRPVLFAVRAFQTYARRASVAREPAGSTGVWVKRLVQAEVPEPLRYQGRLTDVVDNQTRVLIDHWIAEPNRWRCPVVVDARTATAEGSPTATDDSKFVPNKDNVWGPDEAQGTGVFLFVTDFSALPPIVIPTPPTPVVSKQLGFHRGGPVVRNEGPFTPATRVIDLTTLTAGLWDTQEAKSTSRVIAAVALRLPCQGFLDGIDAATVARMVGLGTLYLKDGTEDGTAGAAVIGGLGVFLSVARFVEPAAYGLAFGRDGLRSSRPWDDVAAVGRIFNDDKAGRLLAGVGYLDRDKDKTTPVVSADADEWRGWHSVYRLAAAARTPGAGRAYYDAVRWALLTLGAVKVAMPPPPAPAPPGPPPPKTRSLNDVFTSEQAWAVLLLWHANFPGEVVVPDGKGRKASATLATTVAGVITAGNAVPPATPADEAALTAALANAVQALHTGTDFATAIGTLLTPAAGLGAGLKSFRVDGDHLPQLNDSVGVGLLSILVRLGHAATPTPPTPGPGPAPGPAPTPSPPASAPAQPVASVGLSGVYDTVAQVFKATGVALSMAFTSGVRSLVMALDTPQAFGMEIDEASATPVTASATPGEAPQSVDMYRIKPGSDLSGLSAAAFAFDLGQALGATAFPARGKLDLGNLSFDGAGELTGKIHALFDLDLPFPGGPATLTLAGAGDDGTSQPIGAALSAVALDEAAGTVTARSDVLGDLLNGLPGWPFTLPAGTPLGLTAAVDGDRFGLSLAPTSPLPSLDLTLVPTLVDLHLEQVNVVVDSRTGLGIDLPLGVDKVKAQLASDLFSAAGADTVINHATELIQGAAGDIGRIFRLKPSDATGALLDAGARVVGFDRGTPLVSGALLKQLTALDVNAAKRLRTFAGEIPGAAALLPNSSSSVPSRMHAKLGKAGAVETGDVRVGFDDDTKAWFLEVPLALKFNDEQNHDGDPESVDRRDLFAVEGRFRFEMGGDADFARFDPGSFALMPEVEMTVRDPNAVRGRSFAGLMSLHVPDGSVFAFSTDPTRAGLRWDKEKSEANKVGRILVRVPASDGLASGQDAGDPERKRFTFELDSFAVAPAGIDLGGDVRVEKVSLNDDDSDLDQQTGTGLQAPLAVQKADPKDPGAGDDDPRVGSIHFKKSRLVDGSLRAGFRLRFFDDATGTLGVVMSEDLVTRKLTVTGTVEINRPVSYRFDPLFATFELRSLRFSTTCTRNGSVKWSSEGAISGAVKFLPPAGQSASGPLSALADFFSGVTCEFEDLNPVKLGRGTVVTFTFPPKTFNLANVMEVDLSGITVGDSKQVGSNRHRFGLLGDVRLKDLPGVDGSLTFGGIDLTTSGSGAPELDIKRIGAALTIPGGVEIDATFERIKNELENGFAGAMTVRSDALPPVSGLIKLTDVKCRAVDRTVPSMALYLAADLETPLIFGFYLRNLGLGVGIFQALRGLDSAQNSVPMPQRIIRFVDDPRGLPNPGNVASWVPDPPDKPRGKLNWMLVAQALITYAKYPPDKPHVLAGTLLAALDQDLSLTVASNLWLFAAPEEVSQPEFLARPVARGAMQISPREGKVFGYFRTLPNPKLGADAPELLGRVLNNVQTSYMFLADRNGFLTEVGWPWQTRVDLGLPSPLRGALTSGFRYGLYRGVVVYGLNYGIDVQVDAEAGIDFNTPLGSAGAHLSVHGSGYFRASFVGALDQAFRPYLLGDVRVAASVRVRAEAHAELSRKITRWLRIRLRIRFSASFNLSITAALSAAMDGTGAVGFSGDAHVSVCVSGYRISGQVAFQCRPERVDQVRARLTQILPPPITNAGASLLAPAATSAAAAAPSTGWQHRSRVVPGTRRVLVSLLPAPGTPYPEVPDSDAPPPVPAPTPFDQRFSVRFRPGVPDTAFVGFLGSNDTHFKPAAGTLVWGEDFDHPLISAADLRPQADDNLQAIDDEGPPDRQGPRDLTLAMYLHGLGGSDTAAGGFEGQEHVDPRTRQPAPDDADDDTVGVAPPGVLSPNFGRDSDYDGRVSRSCTRDGEPTKPVARPNPVEGAPFGLVAAEALDLFGRDQVALGGSPPDTMFVAHRLRGTLVFELPAGGTFDALLQRAGGGDDVADDLLDPASFTVLGKATPLVSVLEGSAGRNYDLIPGHVFQSQEILGLCWDFRFQDQKPDDPFEAYTKGFELFRLTRTNQTNPRSRVRVETITPCWLDPSRGGREPDASGASQHVRPPFQHVDRDFGDSETDGDDVVRVGDVILYRVEALGQSGKLLSSCLFEVVRRVVRPIDPPAAALVLHRPGLDNAPTLADTGDVELTLLWTWDQTKKPTVPVPISHDELRVMFRLVPAGSVGSYGFDAPPSASTRPDPGLPAQAMNGLSPSDTQFHVRFSASPQSRPMPWEETKPLGVTAAEWKALTPKGVDDGTQAAAGPEIGASVVLKVADVWKRVEAALGTPPGRDRALEIWVGVERDDDPSGDPAALIERSLLTPFRHAVVLPGTEPADKGVDEHYVTRGSTVAALERLPDRPRDRDPVARFLPASAIVAEVVASSLPAETDPHDVDPATDKVRLAVSWRMPEEPYDAVFEPVVAFRVYRVDRFNPALHRASNLGLEPRPETVAKVMPEALYRATPDAIELLPVTLKDDNGVATVAADWRSTGPATDVALWTVASVADAPSPFPFQDDPDRQGATCLHNDLVKVARKVATAMQAITGDDVRPVWRVRAPFEDRADLRAADDHDKPEAREQRFAGELATFRAAHGTDTDPYGWTTAEEFGLSAEVVFVYEADNQPVDLDGLIRADRGLLARLTDTAETAPVALLMFRADDGETVLNAVRLLHVAPLPGWDDPVAVLRHVKVFDPRVTLGLKLLGRDPALVWPYGTDYKKAGPEAVAWLRDTASKRLAPGLGLAPGTDPLQAAGRLIFYDRSPVSDAGKSPLPRWLPIDAGGMVRIDLPVPDRLAHVYDLALEPLRRYDALWDALAPDTAGTPDLVPYACVRPAKVDRTRPLVPHSVVATPLPAAAQAYVFAHPAEFAACASAVNAAAIEYAGHWAFLQRRIPDLDKIDAALHDSAVLPVDWGDKGYGKWLADRKYEEVEWTDPGRELALEPPVAPDPDATPPVAGDTPAMRILAATRVGIFGADRYVVPDLPAYYEYRFAAVSAAGLARSAAAFTPFVRPLFDAVLQPPSSDGLIAVTYDDKHPDDLTLEVVLAHSRLHLRPEMRGLWVDSDDTLPFTLSDGTTAHRRFGSLPDLSLQYQVLINGNYDPNDLTAFRVLNTLVSLVPPLDPQRQAGGAGLHQFLARSTDEATVKVVATGGTEGREAVVAYRQSATDGSVRVVVRLKLGDTAGARGFRQTLRLAPNGRRHEPFVFFVSRGGVQSVPVAGAAVGS